MGAECGGMDLSWYGRSAWLACGVPEQGPKRCIALQSSQKWRKATDDEAGRDGADGAR